MPKRIFSPFLETEKEFIKDNYLKLPIKHIANKVNCSPHRINRFLKKNNLNVPDEVIRKRKLQYQFKKGHKPFNTGLKQETYMSKENIEKTKATRFKKGHIPKNTKYDGCISYRSENTPNRSYYKYIRISIGDWRLLHHVVWEEVKGEIPKGNLIIFKDGNQENTSIDNLKIVSSVENMYRNSAQNYPEEIIPTMVLLNTINKTIHKLEKDEK